MIEIRRFFALYRALCLNEVIISNFLRAILKERNDRRISVFAIEEILRFAQRDTIRLLVGIGGQLSISPVPSTLPI